MTVAILGGAGYIGSHVVKYLCRAGVPVVVYDNLSHGHANAVSNVPLVQGDIGDRSTLSQCFKDYRVSSVMNFAGLISVGESSYNPRIYYENNLIQTQALLDVMLELEVNDLIFSSTCAIYGVPQDLPLVESHPYAPVSPYGRTKLAVEFMLEDYSQAYGLNYVSLRYFNAAGADPETQMGERHNPETHLIPLLLDVAIGQRQEITIYGTDYPTPDGTCIRDYIHVWDLAQAHWQAQQYLKEHKMSQVFNLGNGIGYSVREVIETCQQVTGQYIAVHESERRAGDPPVLVGSSTKARELLGWKPMYSSLESIISSAWKWHQKWHQISVNAIL